MSIVILLRHADAKPASGIQTDFDRALSKKGVRQAKAVGRWMQSFRYTPDKIIASPALRVRSTLEEVTRYIAWDMDKTLWLADLYDASMQMVMDSMFANSAVGETVLIVGHNPSLSNLVYHLRGDDSLDSSVPKLGTAAIAVFEIDNQEKKLGKWIGNFAPKVTGV